MDTDTTRRRRPAIGMIATTGNVDVIARNVVRAHERGYDCLLAYEDGIAPERLPSVRGTGTEVVHPAESVDDRLDPRSRLKREARRRGHSGLLVHESGESIDFERSEAALRASQLYAVDTVSAPTNRDGDAAEAGTGIVAAIPAYNEAGAIGRVVAETKEFVEQVLVVDDGSTDETVRAAREAGATVIEHTTNGGYGAALRTAFREADARDAERLVVLDGDGQHDPADIPTLVRGQRETGAEIVVGSRFVDGATCDAPLYRLFGLQVVNVLTNLSTGIVRGNAWVADTQSGFRLYDRSAIESLSKEKIGESMSASTDILYHAHRNDYEVDEVGVSVTYDVENPSSHHPVLHGLTLVSNILKTVTRDRSRTVFGRTRPDADVTNALSFDLEHWHSATLLRDEVDDPADRVEESVAIVLDLLRRHDVHATFFVVGELAAEYPRLVRRIRKEGHEIASHGHTHTPLFELTPETFADELRRSSEAIEDAAGVRPRGFRAPNFSITPVTDWAFQVLESSDYLFDSSVFPVKTPMYGVSGASTEPYTVTADSPFGRRNGTPSNGLVEFPLSVASARVPLPIAGGFYARVLPASVLDRGIRRLNRRGTPANLYFHPWEFNPDVRIDCSLPKRTVSFAGIERTEAKLDRLLAAHEFGTVGSVLAERAFLDEQASSPLSALRETDVEVDRG
ncbi:polysaccharide deacetylase family protein [Halogeometricum luteum]|uniref:DUF3473 domain-containing protein n=1 Tax=Halogeometricum luteum TaxID=2950537 RepID=A0ABU2G3D9_9EURY|nr:DUF3473 domain-containing protein [Halogeometricum sp. S3BR5-2]MDS0295295.1 DUF3473 domain-containing protein [Halogeometricum sp. S3BR5-2]